MHPSTTPPRPDPSRTQPGYNPSPAGGLTVPPGYAVERELARGGMGVVYKATQTGLKRPCALKLMLAPDGAGVLRFLAEAEAVAAVDHPQVVRVYDFGRHAGGPYLAMEFCPGGTLADLLKVATLAPADAATLVAGLAEAVGAAHAAGIVHRDLKPGNVLFDAAGVAKVCDFGLAKRAEGVDLTRTGAVMGTPAYMSPEQAKGDTKLVSPPADVWALGVILYECLTGRRPFAGDTTWSVLRQVQTASPATVRTVVRDVPRDLERVCLKCLEKDPSDRYPTAGELAADLRRHLAGEPVRVRPAGRLERGYKWARRNPAAATAYGSGLLAASLAVVGLVVGSLWRQASAERAAADVLRGEADDQRRAAETARDALAREQAKLAMVEYGRAVQMAHKAWLDDDVFTARQILADCRADLRSWEWHYVHRLCHPPVTVVPLVKQTPARLLLDRFPGGTAVVRVSPSEAIKLAGRTSRLQAAALSPNGDQVATIATAGNGRHVVVRVWDVITGVERSTHKLVGPMPYDVWWLDAETVVVPLDATRQIVLPAASDREAHRLYDTSDIREGEWGRVARVLKQQTPTTEQSVVAVSCDGRRQARAVGGKLEFWDRAVRTAVVELDSTQVTMTASRQYLQIASSDKSKPATLGTVHIAYKAGGVMALAFAPDGRRCAAIHAQDASHVQFRMSVFDTDFGRSLVSMSVSDMSATALDWHPMADRIVFNWGNGVSVWDATFGTQLLVLERHLNPPKIAGWDRTGNRLLTANMATSNADATYMWDGTPVPPDRLVDPQPHGYYQSTHPLAPRVMPAPARTP